MKICNLSVVCVISAVFSLLCAGAYGEDEIKKLYLDGGGGQIADMAYHYLVGETNVNCKWIQGSDLSISGKNARIDPVSKFAQARLLRRRRRPDRQPRRRRHDYPLALMGSVGRPISKSVKKG